MQYQSCKSNYHTITAMTAPVGLLTWPFPWIYLYWGGGMRLDGYEHRKSNYHMITYFMNGSSCTRITPPPELCAWFVPHNQCFRLIIPSWEETRYMYIMYLHCGSSGRKHMISDKIDQCLNLPYFRVFNNIIW